MSQPKKLLFVCSHNRRRSITAERMFLDISGYEVRSAGTSRGARVRVTEEAIQWADFVFAMEHDHVHELRRRFKKALAGKRLICLQVPDTYGYMSFELLAVLKERLSHYIPLPR